MHSEKSKQKFSKTLGKPPLHSVLCTMGYCASKSCCERAVTGTRKWGLLLWYPIRLCYVVPLSFCFAIEKNSTKQHEVHENVPFSFFHCIRYWLQHEHSSIAIGFDSKTAKDSKVLLTAWFLYLTKSNYASVAYYLAMVLIHQTTKYQKEWLAWSLKSRNHLFTDTLE